MCYREKEREGERERERDRGCIKERLKINVCRFWSKTSPASYSMARPPLKVSRGGYAMQCMSIVHTTEHWIQVLKGLAYLAKQWDPYLE